jgi:hypothetical protein
MFDSLRALPVGEFAPVRVRAVKDLTWSDGKTDHPHAKAGDEGRLFARTGAGFLVEFVGTGFRQVFDFQGEKELFRADDEIALI